MPTKQIALPQTTSSAMAAQAAACRHFGFGYLANTPAPGGPVSFTEAELETKDGRGLTMRHMLEVQRQQLAEKRFVTLPSVHNALTRWALANNRLGDPDNGVGWPHEVPRGTDLQSFVANYALEAAHLMGKHGGSKGIAEHAVQRAKAYGNVVYPNPCDRTPNHALYSMIEKQPEAVRVYVFGNGSHFAGSREDDFAMLFSRLETHPLDIGRFGLYGFCDLAPVSCQTRSPLFPEGFQSFSGNFLNLSAGFHIVSNDKEVNQALEAAIERNLGRQQRESF